MFSILENLQKNILYITYKVDSIGKIVKKHDIDKDLQTQVDTFFHQDEDTEHIPEDSDGNRPD